MGAVADWWKKNVEDPIMELYEYSVDNFDDFVEYGLLPQFEDNPIADWLYADDWTKGKYAIYQASHIVPVAGAYLDWLLDVRKAKEYMNRNQLDWQDIHDPRNLPGNGSLARVAGSALNFVSDNIKRLYK